MQGSQIRKKREDEVGDPYLKDVMIFVKEAAEEANDPIIKTEQSMEKRHQVIRVDNWQASAVFSTMSANIIT